MKKKTILFWYFKYFKIFYLLFFQKLIHENVDGVDISYLPITSWLLLFNSYSSLMTGKWFKRFVAKCADNVPVAIDIYMDGWKVSNLKKAVGLYFIIVNLDKSLNWKVTHKFPICLIPLLVNLQHVLSILLADVGYKLPAKEYALSLFQGEKKMVKVEIARVIGDTPGIAEFCGVKNHRCGGIFFFPTCIFFF